MAGVIQPLKYQKLKQETIPNNTDEIIDDLNADKSSGDDEPRVENNIDSATTEHSAKGYIFTWINAGVKQCFQAEVIDDDILDIFTALTYVNANLNVPNFSRKPSFILP